MVDIRRCIIIKWKENYQPKSQKRGNWTSNNKLIRFSQSNLTERATQVSNKVTIKVMKVRKGAVKVTKRAVQTRDRAIKITNKSIKD